MRKKSICALTSMLLGASVYTHAGDFGYSYVQAGYTASETEFLDVDIDGDTFGFSGSAEISDSTYMIAGYSETDYDFDIDSTTFVVGLGGHTVVSINTDAFIEAAFINQDVEFSGFGSEDDNGYGINTGLRYAVSNRIELNTNISYVDIFDDTETSFGFGGRAKLNNAISLGASYGKADDTTAVTLSLRGNF